MGTFVNPQSLAQIICPFCETLIATPVREMRSQPVFTCPHCDGTLSAARLCLLCDKLDEEFGHLPRRRQQAPETAVDTNERAKEQPSTHSFPKRVRAPYEAPFVRRGWRADPVAAPAYLRRAAGAQGKR